MDIICSGFRPPAIKSPTASTDCTIPHSTFLEFGGFRLPFEESIDKTKVPEFAEVIKNVHNKTSAITDKMVPIGYSFMTTNNPVSGVFATSFNVSTDKVPVSPR